MAKKAPRRTAERIATVSLDLFNRYGEPNVSTTLISSELNISPGNLYYHFPAKDQLVSHLFDNYKEDILKLLDASQDVKDVEDAWFFLHSLFELIWDHRFLYRDLNDLLSKNRHLETNFKHILEVKTASLNQLLQALARQGHIRNEPDTFSTLSASMSVVVTYWLSYEYVRNPRHAMEPESASDALARGARHVLLLLAPYLENASERAHLMQLTQAYVAANASSSND
jgi:AcrR family transcriptional regulator